MVSDIVNYYLHSTFRKRLLGEIVDKYSEGREKDPTEIYIESAVITAGRPEDDGVIIEFLSRLGDVEVDVVRDNYSLKFKSGTFDNWISREEFRQKCNEWDEVYEFEDYPTVCYCYYDYTNGRISSSPPTNGIHILFSPVNIIFEIQGGLQFPRFRAKLEPDISEFEKYFQEMCRRGILRHPLIPERPIYMDCLDSIRNWSDRFTDIVVNAIYDGTKIDIVQPRDDGWITRIEALDHIKSEAEQKEYVETYYGTFNSKYLHDIDISNIGNKGIARSNYEIRLELDGVMEAERIPYFAVYTDFTDCVYRDYP